MRSLTSNIVISKTLDGTVATDGTAASGITNTTILMSSYRSEILQFPNRVMYAELEAYFINIWANVFPMIYCYVFIFRNPHTMKPILTRESNWICFR